MTYQPTAPFVTKSPKDSAVDILNNYSKIASVFSQTVGSVIYNHMPFNNQFQGNHAAILFQNINGNPGVTGDLTNLYAVNAISNISPSPGQPQLFAQIPKFLPTELDPTIAPNTPMQLTFNQVNLTGPIYQGFLAGGYLIYTGNVSTNTAPTTPFSINLSPIPTKVLCAIAMPNTVETGSTHQPIQISAQKINSGLVQVYTNFTGTRNFNFIIIAQA